MGTLLTTNCTCPQTAAGPRKDCINLQQRLHQTNICKGNALILMSFLSGYIVEACYIFIMPVESYLGGRHNLKNSIMIKVSIQLSCDV